MINKLVFLILIYFAIGAAAIIQINKKKAGSGNQWKKYFVYMIIVSAIVCSIALKGFVFIACLLLTFGLFELLGTWIKSSTKRNIIILSGIVIYLLTGVEFLRFSMLENRNEQLFTYALVFTFDGFSQIVGQLIGRTKPFQKISPNKTMEGVIGGFITTMITSVFLGKYLLFSIEKTLIVAAGIAIIAFAGDLAASYFKRQCNVKDFSNLIPGHGGVLDRFDSFIAAGAFYWIISQY